MKKADIYKTRHLLVRDKDKNFEQFVSKLQKEREKLEFLGLSKKSIARPINYIEAYPDNSVKLTSDAIIETAKNLADHSE